MLVLSRKRDERILIGNEIEVKVLSVEGSRVRLGITCPKEFRIVRSEILKDRPLPRQTLEIVNSLCPRAERNTPSEVSAIG